MESLSWVADVLASYRAVVPVLTGTSASALLLADRMRRRGVNVQPIVYPAVPDAAARLRFFLNTSHTDAHIDEAVAILAQESGRPAPATVKSGPATARRAYWHNGWDHGPAG